MSSIQLITELSLLKLVLVQRNSEKEISQIREWNELTSGVKELEKANLFIDDTPALSVFDLRAKVRR